MAVAPKKLSGAVKIVLEVEQIVGDIYFRSRDASISSDHFRFKTDNSDSLSESISIVTYTNTVEAYRRILSRCNLRCLDQLRPLVA